MVDAPKKPLHDVLLATFKVFDQSAQAFHDARQALEVVVGQASVQLAEDDHARERLAQKEADVDLQLLQLRAERAELETEKARVAALGGTAVEPTAAASATVTAAASASAGSGTQVATGHGAPMPSAVLTSEPGRGGGGKAERVDGIARSAFSAGHEDSEAHGASDAEGGGSPEGSERSSGGDGAGAPLPGTGASSSGGPAAAALDNAAPARVGAAIRAGGRVADHDRDDAVRWAIDAAAEAAATASRSLQEALGYAGGSESEHHLALAQHNLEAQPRTAEQAARACDAVRLARGCCPPEADAAVKAATKAIRDVVVLRCCTMAGHSNRAAVLVALAEAFGRQLDCELESQLLLAYGRVTRHVADAFTSNNQLRGARRLRKKPPRAQLAAQQAAQSAGSAQPARTGSPLALRAPPALLSGAPWAGSTLAAASREPALLQPGRRAPGRCASVDIVPHVVAPPAHVGARLGVDVDAPREGPLLVGATSSRGAWGPACGGSRGGGGGGGSGLDGNSLEPQWVSLPSCSYTRSHSANPRVGLWGGSTAVHDEPLVYNPCAFEEAGAVAGLHAVAMSVQGPPWDAALPRGLLLDDDGEDEGAGRRAQAGGSGAAAGVRAGAKACGQRMLGRHEEDNHIQWDGGVHIRPDHDIQPLLDGVLQEQSIGRRSPPAGSWRAPGEAPPGFGRRCNAPDVSDTQGYRLW